MNTYSRNERFQGHLISALPYYYVCAECHSHLIYAGDSQSEKISCIHSEHNGLVKIEDVQLEGQQKLLTDGQDYFSTLMSLPKDSPLLAIIKARNKRAKVSLFGDDDA